MVYLQTKFPGLEPHIGPGPNGGSAIKELPVVHSAIRKLVAVCRRMPASPAIASQSVTSLASESTAVWLTTGSVLAVRLPQ